MSTNDKLRDALKESHMLIQPVPDASVTAFDLAKAVSERALRVCQLLEEALAASKPEPVGINGLTEAETSATASVMGLTRKQEPQAQAEPEVVAYALGDGLFDTPLDYEHSRLYGTGTPLITLQSHREAMAKAVRIVQDDWELDVRQHREAIAKKDAAWDACVGALEIADKFCDSLSADECPDTAALPIKAAIAQAKEARKLLLGF